MLEFPFLAELEEAPFQFDVPLADCDLEGLIREWDEHQLSQHLLTASSGASVPGASELPLPLNFVGPKAEALGTAGVDMIASMPVGVQEVSNSLKKPKSKSLFKKNHCMAENCHIDLRSANLPFYNLRNHICTTHAKAECFKLEGKLSRFCQRCATAHELSAFDGTRRSCRESLERYNSQRRSKNTSNSTMTTASPYEPAPSGAVPQFIASEALQKCLPSQMQASQLQLYMVLAPPNTLFPEGSTVVSVHEASLTTTTTTTTSQSS